MISKIEKEVTLRFLKTKKNDGFLNIISIFSFIGISLGVAVLIIVMSVMNGFRTELIDKIVGFNAHAVVKPYNKSLKIIHDVDFALNILPSLNSKSTYIPNTIEESSIRSVINHSKDTFRHKLNFKNELFNVVVIGRLMERKNQNLVINNLDKYKTLNKKIHFHFIGRNFTSDD